MQQFFVMQQYYFIYFCDYEFWTMLISMLSSMLSGKNWKKWLTTMYFYPTYHNYNIKTEKESSKTSMNFVCILYKSPIFLLLSACIVNLCVNILQGQNKPCWLAYTWRTYIYISIYRQQNLFSTSLGPHYNRIGL